MTVVHNLSVWDNYILPIVLPTYLYMRGLRPREERQDTSLRDAGYLKNYREETY